MLEPKRVGGRLEFSFVAPDDLDYVTLNKGDFIGDLKLEEIQLEQSTLSTNFVEPMESETVESGLFKSVQGISYEITDPNSDTWAEIKQTVDGSITTYHNGTLQSTMAHTIEDIIFGISDIAGDDESSFNLRLDGIQQSVKDEMFESVQTQLSDFVGIQISDIEGNYNHILNTVNAHTQTIGSDGGNLAQKVMNDSLFQINVIDEIAGAKSSYTQLANQIGLRVGDSQITIGGEGIIIDSESVYINDSTKISDGIITNRMVAANAELDGAKIATATIGGAQIASLDVDKISGNTTNFVRSAWNAINSNLTIDGTSLKITTPNNWDMHLGNAGVTFTGKTGTLTGSLRATRSTDGAPEGTFVIAERGYLAGLGRRLSDGLLRSSLYVEGNSGDVTVTRPMRTEQSIEVGEYNRLVRYEGQTTVAFEHRSSVNADYDWNTDRIWAVGLSTTMNMHATLNMNGYEITGQSDIRLKKNIEDSNVNALREIERLRFIEFDWDTSKRPSDSKPEGRQFGIVAQHSPFLQTKLESEDSYLSTDYTKQINLNSKGLQELIYYTRSLEERIEVLENG